MTLKRAAAWFVVVLLAPQCSGRAAEGSGWERCEFVEPHMGTLFRIVLFTPHPATSQEAARTAFDRISALNRILSDYDSESELMRLCRHPFGKPVPVSTDLFTVLQRSQELAELTHGAFDVTLGPLVRLWRETRRTGALPDSAARAQATRSVGFAHLHLDSSTRTVTLTKSGMQLDFGGLAKGYAADEALALLTQLGFTRAMVAAGGDLALGDPPPGKTGWKIELAPFGSATDTPLTLLLAHCGVSTSGDTEQFVEIDGERYSHIVNPTTGLGLTKPIAVTVIARNATLSDGLATACSVLDIDGVRSLVGRTPELRRVMVHQANADGSVSRTIYDQPPNARSLSSP